MYRCIYIYTGFSMWDVFMSLARVMSIARVSKGTPQRLCIPKLHGTLLLTCVA